MGRWRACCPQLYHPQNPVCTYAAKYPSPAFARIPDTNRLVEDLRLHTTCRKSLRKQLKSPPVMAAGSIGLAWQQQLGPQELILRTQSEVTAAVNFAFIHL